MKTLYHKQAKNRRKHDFLLTFFSTPDQNESKAVNGYVLNKYFSGNTQQWEVMIFTNDSFGKQQGLRL